MTSRTDTFQRSLQQIVDLSPYFDNEGISSVQQKVGGGLESLGTVFRAESLPESRTIITCNGIDFLFPDKSIGINDNIACEAQEILLPPGHYFALHVLGMSDWRAFEEILILNYLNGTCSEVLFGLSDASCYRGRLYGELEAIQCKLVTLDSLIPHVYLFGIPMPGEGYQMKEIETEAKIWHQVIPVETSWPLSGLTLPDNPSMHIFALTLCAMLEES